MVKRTGLATQNRTRAHSTRQNKLTKAKLAAGKPFAHSSGWGCEPSSANGLRHRCAKRTGIAERIGAAIEIRIRTQEKERFTPLQACHGRARSASVGGCEPLAVKKNI